MQICQVTLQLFDVLLNAPLYSVVSDLVLVHWPDSSERPCLVMPTKEIASERHHLEQTINDYLSLVPEELTSCKHVAGDLGLEQYLIDAHHQVVHVQSLVFVVLTACLMTMKTVNFSLAVILLG